MVYEDDYTEIIGVELLKNNLKEKPMKNGILTLSKENVYSALVYGLLSVAILIISKGTIFGLDWKVLVDACVLGIMTSLVKNLLTTNSGNFAGLVGVIPDK